MLNVPLYVAHALASLLNDDIYKLLCIPCICYTPDDGPERAKTYWRFL